MQLTISADNHVELAYTECGGQGQVPNRWKNVIRLSRGPGSQWADTKNGETQIAPAPTPPPHLPCRPWRVHALSAHRPAYAS